MTSGETAPGHPGAYPTWSSSSKTGVGTALPRGSRVWFTMAEGIISEIFFPQIDTPAVRDLQFMVTDGQDFFSDQRRDTECTVKRLAPGVPAYQMESRCKQGRYRLEQEIVADPDRSVLLVKVRLIPERLENPRLYVLLAPHLCNRGWGNHAWVEDFKGVPVLFAHGMGADGPSYLALGCSVPFRKRSVGYSGVSDGWQDVSRHGRMEWEYRHAPDGNVALTAELDTAKELSAVIAVGFGTTAMGAGHHLLASLIDGFDSRVRLYITEWRSYLDSLQFCSEEERHPLARVSVSVIGAHEGKEYPGALAASLSTPWGEYRSDGETGYHMVWTRDLIEAIGGLLAVGAHGCARRALTYLHTTQEADGRWPQNMFVDGRPHWTGIQLDEIGFPVLLAFLAERTGAIHERQLARYWPTVQSAARYILNHGPATPMDRWEEFGGYSPFTLAVEISALQSVAAYAEKMGETSFAQTARQVADEWNARIEDWIYVRDTDLARKVGVEGYYAFILPETSSENPMARERVSPDALALVRFGLRAPKDARILNTIRVIDATLRVETLVGPCWRRYTGDRYGESDTGEPFRQGANGVGRLWPLLTGERAHYELAAGNRNEAIRLMHTMEAFANDSGFLPEQIWDGSNLPEKGLYTGRPSGSAMPLVWAHAEYLKLRRSIFDNRVFDLPVG